MVRPDQEAIDTFMSITGVSEAAAIQKLEVVCYCYSQCRLLNASVTSFDQLFEFDVLLGV